MQPKPFWFEAMSADEAQRWRRPWVTLTIVILCAALFGLQYLLPSVPFFAPFQFRWPDAWFKAYTLITPIFLHFSILHIAFNTSIFWFFARQIETLLGSGVLFGVVLLTGLASNLGQYFAQGPRFGGLSGVVLAVIGFVWMSEKFGGPRFFVPKGLMVFVLCSLALGFTGLLDQLLGPIAHVAHTVGFVAGLFLWPLVSALQPMLSRKKEQL